MGDDTRSTKSKSGGTPRLSAETPSPGEAPLPWAVWFEAARGERIDTSIRELYKRLDEAITERNPTCWLSGRCCRFDEFDHRLYVTGLEVAWVVLQTGPRDAHAEHDAAQREAGLCPFQVDKLCAAHEVRPLGCRVFFCQDGTQDWQQGVYESFLNDLRALHERHGLPYAYLEWREALSAAHSQPPSISRR